jgi:hypothetical protein
MPEEEEGENRVVEGAARGGQGCPMRGLAWTQCGKGRMGGLTEWHRTGQERGGIRVELLS